MHHQKNMTKNNTQAEMFEAAEAVLPGGGLGGYALDLEVRFVFAEGSGARFRAVDGREYIDYTGGAGALILGHSPKSVVAAAQKQLARGMHMFGALSDVGITLAAKLVRDIPCAEKIAFATTGSEATAYCMRLARAFTGREQIIKFEGAYHGNHDYTLVSTFPNKIGAYPQGIADTGGQPQAVRDVMKIAPYNDLAATTKIAEDVGENLAAIIVEPVQRIIAGEDDFLHGLRALCDKLGAVLIFDEVVTGFRLAYGGAHAAMGIRPDLASFGKVIGAGGPLAAVGGRADIINLADPRKKGQKDYAYFNGTLHGNPLAAAATLALLDEIQQQPKFYENLNNTTALFCNDAQKVLHKRGLNAIVVHAGSLWQILFMKKPPRNYADYAGGDINAMRKLDSELLKRGQYLLPGVRRFISAAHSGKEFEETLKALDESAAVM